ncbi:MAG: DUF433 domain-containing protein [Gemmataceae bacterium]
MATVREVLNQIQELNPIQQRDLVQAWDKLGGPEELFPLIVKTNDVCGGDARIIRTRIPVWTLQRLRELGQSDTEILRAYPSLRHTDLSHAWIYSDTHGEEIRLAIQENEEA